MRKQCVPGLSSGGRGLGMRLIMGSSLCYHGYSSLHTPSQDGMTPLMVASYKGHSRVVRVLLQAGAIPNATSQVRYSSCQMLPQGSFVCWKYMCTQFPTLGTQILQCHMHTFISSYTQTHDCLLSLEGLPFMLQ